MKRSIEQPKRTITFLTNLLAAVQQVPGLQAELQNPTFLDALMQFGLTAAQLNLNPATGPEPLWSFLDTLWQGTTPGDIRLAAQQLQTFFEDATTADQQLKLLEFEQKMLTAIKLVPALEVDRKDPSYLADVVEVTKSYALSKLNKEEGVVYEENDFLKSLWYAQNQNQIQASANRLIAFIENQDTPPFTEPESNPDVDEEDKLKDLNPLSFDEALATRSIDALLAGPFHSN